MRSTSLAVAAAVLALVARPAPVSAEGIGPLLPKGAFEIGIQNRYVERTQVAVENQTTLDERDLAVTVRWAATEFATLSLEGMTGSQSFFSGYDDLETFYLIGGALQAMLWRNDRLVVTAGLQYTETYRRWKDADQCDRTTSALCWQILAQTDTHPMGQTLTLFAGPVYSEDDLLIPEGIGCVPVSMDSDPNWGGLVGVTAVLGGHVTFNAHLLWVENPQPRLGVGYRF